MAGNEVYLPFMADNFVLPLFEMNSNMQLADTTKLRLVPFDNFRIEMDSEAKEELPPALDNLVFVAR